MNTVRRKGGEITEYGNAKGEEEVSKKVRKGRRNEGI